ncbi:hypothetical protein GCM10027036_20560 [Flavihumibacter cheonanensis]
MLFQNDEVGYIGGRRFDWLEVVNNEKINFKEIAVLYKTENQGKNWKQIPLPYSGSVDKITVFGDTLILEINTYNDTTMLVQSNNQGKDWINLLILTKYGRIRDTQFNNSKDGRLLTTDSTHGYLIQYHNTKFDTIQTFIGNDVFAILQNQVISFRRDTATAAYSGYILTDVKTGYRKEIPFDISYYISFSYYSKHADHLYFAANHNQIGTILKVTNAGYEVIDLGQYAQCIPDKVFAFGNTIMAICASQDNIGPIGVIHTFLISSDGGKTWMKEDLPSPMCVTTPAIFKDQFFIAGSCPNNYFQIRK